MRRSERKLYEQEAEILPNRYVALAMTVLSIFIIGMLLVNELDIFLVSKVWMRAGAFASLVVLEIPLFMAGTDTGLRNPRTKYVMIGCAGVVTAILCTALNFHATLALFLPILLATQYPNSKMSRIAILCSIFCAAVAPVIGYLSGMWDMAFVERLSQIGGLAVREAAEGEQMARGTAVAQILLYVSLPHILILLAFSPLSIAIAHSGEVRLKNQIQVLHLGESDALTGLLNRQSFEEAMKQEMVAGDGNVAVVYVDANNLHRLNNEQGHSAGDRMLICVAESMRDAFGDESVYRTGGDEFISIVYGLSCAEICEHLAQVRSRVEQQGYSIAAGIEVAQLPCTLPVLVDAAETKMMINKETYHIIR